MPEQMIEIPMDKENEAFFEWSAKEELRIQGCDSCDRLRFPPRPICPWCHSTDSSWRVMSGRGSIWSFAVTHPPLLEPFLSRAPYNVVVVEIEEDPLIRLIGNVVEDRKVGLEFVKPDELRIGAPVRAVFPVVEGEPRLLRWALEPG
jgi:uncharacterized OB-fold protein